MDRQTDRQMDRQIDRNTIHQWVHSAIHAPYNHQTAEAFETAQVDTDQDYPQLTGNL